jgi:signal transduction histidine kinase
MKAFIVAAFFVVLCSYQSVFTQTKNQVLLLEQQVEHYYENRNYDSSLYFSNKAIPLAKQLKMDSLTASLYRAKGNCYTLLFEQKKALENYQTALELAKQNKFLYLQADVQRNIASIYIVRQQINEAEKWLEKSVAIYQSLSDKHSTSYLNTRYLLMACYHHTKKIKEVLPVCKELVDELRQSKEKELLVSVLLFYAECLIEAQETEIAVDIIEEAEKIVNEGDDIELKVQFFREKSKMLMAKKDSEGAYNSLLEAFNNYPKILNKEVAQTASEAEIKYKTKLLAEEKKRAEAEKQNAETKFRYLFILIIILIIVSIVFLMFRNKQLKIQREIKIKEERMTALLEGEEKERERISKELHDGIVQELTAFKFGLNGLEKNLPDEDRTSLIQLNSDISRISNEVRELSYQMMPVTLKELGLINALNELLNRSLLRQGIEVEFNSFGLSERLSEKIETTVYRIVQELINNTIKHSNASHVSLLLQLRNQVLQVTYEDNGIGYDTETVKKGIGLNSLGSRIKLVRGSFDIESSQMSGGTTAYIRIPLMIGNEKMEK